MKSHNQYHGILPYAVDSVRHWAQRLIQHPAFGPSDLEDLEQELMLDLHRRVPKFNPKKAGLHTFISRVLAHCAATLIQKATSSKRGGGREIISLNSNIANNHEGFQLELLDTVSSEQDLWTDTEPSTNDLFEIRMDMQRVLNELATPLKQLAVRLLNETVTEISREMGTPRSTLYDAIGRIRSLFQTMGYTKSDIYLPRHSAPVILRFAMQGK
ncbi:MAG: sigma-70 family RNA polymerase sigma factor [Magnetococcales bacterium]|nr:sigma-70 family RNA polymerase sigma factor [Magnetococcales bacterium]